jgi:protein transport protein SEC24
MDTGAIMYVYVCRALADHHARALFDAATFTHIDDEAVGARVPCACSHECSQLSLPTTTAPLNVAVRAFVQQLNAQRPFVAALIVIRLVYMLGDADECATHIYSEDSAQRDKFTRRLIDDRTESTYSYVDFLRHVRKEIPPKR